MKKNDKIFVAGHKGLAGSAILRKLIDQGYTNLVLRTHQELDLENQTDVRVFFEKERPEYVFLAAAKVGGIHANNVYRADFLIKNLKIQNNVIESAYRFGSKKLLFLGSSCIYPKLAPQPLKEEYLLTGLLEPTNEPYAIAKIAGIKLCESYNRQYGTDFISAMPTNLYGPNDNFDLNNSHVLPALIRKFVEARDRNASEVTIWGTGTPLREFLHVDDLADALIFLMMHYSGNEFVNVGTGREISILDLAHCIKRLTAYSGKLEFDSSKPDGTPRKVMDISKLNAMGWYPKISLDTGLKQTIDWYEKHV
ncbi:MAG TPA: GDP-L-fucose synthase [bacterium]|nr:GDP-L-fucose synthase [bacterium]HMW32126.1 GDP-L-fucose synthase [bacterium]HMY35182.1 GDP-L-fucose synthase [bacterium]HMZ03149.1 GDP-L-fucose synthase [bacterium]HNB09567.1 GDP-L-fucose synthase [bacterium]